MTSSMPERPRRQRTIRRSSHNWLEPLIVAFGVALLVLIASRAYFGARYTSLAAQYGYYAADGIAELEPIRQRYGPHRYSRNVEEWCIRDFFNDRRGGVFVDVGANHYLKESNTYFLETELGWSGLAIEAQAEFGLDYRLHRPRTRFVAAFATDVAGAAASLFVPPDNSPLASSNRDFTLRHGYTGVAAREVPTTTLDVALGEAHISKVDFLSMDIELAEPAALRGFDIAAFKPDLVCIEAHAEVRQDILNYFAAQRYVLIGKYLRTDPKNLYFTRLPIDVPGK